MGTPLSLSEAKIFYSELCKQNSIVYPLTRLFDKEINYATLTDNGRNGLCARIKKHELSDMVAMSLSNSNPGAVLHIYIGDIEDILKYGESDSIFCNKKVSLYATPRETGTWMLGKGHEMSWRLSVYAPYHIILPSEFGIWFFDSMKWLSTISTEHSFPDEAETFWEGDKERP